MPVESTGHQFPIQHPEYRYPDSRNPYWTKLQSLRDLVYSDNETEAHRGQWRQLFQDHSQFLGDRKLHVEIGCNAGHVLVEWAKTHPQDAYIGLDWKFKAIFRGAEKAVNRNLKNALFFRAHAERLPFMFGPEEIDYLYLFFPDPWDKRAQHKYRLITPERLRLFSQKMKPGGVFHIKTDHPDYFKWILKAVTQVEDSWKVIESFSDLYRDHPAPERLTIPEVTLFERLFIKDGLPIQSLKLGKVS